MDGYPKNDGGDHQVREIGVLTIRCVRQYVEGIAKNGGNAQTNEQKQDERKNGKKKLSDHGGWVWYYQSSARGQPDHIPSMKAK